MAKKERNNQEEVNEQKRNEKDDTQNEAEVSEDTRNSTVNQDFDHNTQVILVEENEYAHSFNWRLTKKNIGSFLVIILSMLFFFFLFRIDKVAVLISKFASVLQPITLGIVMAYLLNPVEKFVEIRILKLKKEPGKNHGVRHALTIEQQMAFISKLLE